MLKQQHAQKARQYCLLINNGRALFTQLNAMRNAWKRDGDSSAERAQEDLYKASVVTANNAVTVCRIFNPQRCQMHMTVCGLFVIRVTTFRLPLSKFYLTENTGLYIDVFS